MKKRLLNKNAFLLVATLATTPTGYFVGEVLDEKYPQTREEEHFCCCTGKRVTEVIPEPNWFKKICTVNGVLFGVLVGLRRLTINQEKESEDLGK